MVTVVGSMDNVPAPGDPIRSPWAIEISGLARSIFPDKATLDAQWATAPNGSHAFTIADGKAWDRVAGVWRIATQIGAVNTQGPYVGGWPAGAAEARQLTARAGHATLTTSAFGDGTVNFSAAFPAGVIAVTAQPVETASGRFWWPQIHTVTLSSFSFFAVSVNGYPLATAHPPGAAAVWTVQGSVTLDYWAFGV